MNKQPTFCFPWAIPIIILLVPFLYAAFFTFPEGDDFASAIKASFPFDFIGGFHQMLSYWWKWSGRYSHAFSLVFFGDACNYRGTYTAVILLAFFTLWLSIFGIVKELGRKEDTGQPAFIATFWLFAVLSSYGTVQQWYLLVELTSLLAGYVFSLVYIWSLCRLWNRTEITRSVKWFPILSCIIAAGFYEHSAPLVLAISVMAWVLSILYDHPNRKIYFLLVKISIVCFLLTYLARGNFRRQTKRGMTFAAMFEQLLNAGKDWWKFVVPAYCNPIYIAAFFVAVWVTPRSKEQLTTKIPAPLILAGSLVLFCGFSFALTVVHALSDVTVGEADKIPANIAQYSVVFVFFGLFACREWLRLPAMRLLGRPLSLLAMVVILVIGNSNFFPVLWNCLSGEIARYAHAYEKRKTVMAENAGHAIHVMPLALAPVPIASDTLMEGVKSWPNKYAAPFYGMKSLTIKRPDPASAFATGLAKEEINWRSVLPGVRAAYIPSLNLEKNNPTYRFDWIFVESDSGSTPNVRIACLDNKLMANAVHASANVSERLLSGEWPFGRIFATGPLQTFKYGGRKYFAVPLPLLDSGESGRSENILIFLNGRLFTAR